MFCQNCGNEIKENQSFCRSCGNQFSKSEIILQKRDWIKSISFFSLGIIIGFFFMLLTYYYVSKLGNANDGLMVLLLVLPLLFGVISVLLRELKETKRKFEKETVNREIKSFPAQQKQIEEKPFIPTSWSVTDMTTENLLSTKKRISGEL